MRNLRTIVTILTAAAAFGLPALGAATASAEIDSTDLGADVTITGTADGSPDDTPWG
jgi:hypothetical protein